MNDVTLDTAPAASTTRSTRARRRPPWTVHLAAVPLVLMNAVTCVGAVYFGTHDDPTRPPGAPDPGSWQAWVLIAVLVGYALAGLLSVPGMYRRSRTAWTVAMGFLAAHALFGALKYLGLGEAAALPFLVVDLVVAAALAAPATRRYVGVR
jgi:lysylphosphatidylglycerol synthetase-like protein (DUF2156 family)